MKDIAEWHDEVCLAARHDGSDDEDWYGVIDAIEAQVRRADEIEFLYGGLQHVHLKDNEFLIGLLRKVASAPTPHDGVKVAQQYLAEVST